MRTAKRPIPLRVAADEWITVQQAADHLGVHHEAIYQACKSRGLRHAKLGRSTIRLRLAWVDEWAESLAALPIDAGKR
jgi:excisionase family DNA binding protein